MHNINSTPSSLINHKQTMLLRFIKNLKRSTFNDESITGKSFRLTAKTVFRVGVTKNLSNSKFGGQIG